MRFPRQRLVAMAIAGCLLAGCSGEEGSNRREDRTPSAGPFSDADKTAARALSIGNTVELQEADTAYGRALLCTSAIDSIIERLAEAGGISDAQSKQIETVRDLYFRQLLAAGTADGKSESAVEAELTEVAANAADPNAHARMAIACIGELESRARG